MKTAAYFKARAEAVKRRGMAQADKAAAQAVREYQKAGEAVAAEVRKIYERYGKDYGLTYAEAQRALTGSACKDWRMTLSEYAERINQTGHKALLAELDALSARSRISRYEQLRTAISVETSVLAKKQEERVEQLLSGLYEESCYRTAYDLQKGLGVGKSLALLPKAEIAEAVSYPWSGADFSERLWGNSRNLAEDLRRTLTQGLIRGQDLRQMTKALQEKTQAAARDCERLIQTESARILEDGELQSYRRCGVTKYEILGTLDRRTCPVCGKQDGKVYAVDDAQTGKNYPPFHPRCRCTTVAVFDEEAGEAESSLRAGRDEAEDYTLFPADMTYEEWKEGLKRTDVRENYTEVDTSSNISGKVSDATVRKINEAYAKIAGDFPHVEDYMDKIYFLDSDDPSPASACLKEEPDTGKVSICLELNTKHWYNKNTMERVDAAHTHIVTAQREMAIVAHESGHLICYAAALKESSYSPGSRITPMQRAAVQTTLNRIYQGCYLAAFTDESYEEIVEKIRKEVSLRATVSGAEFAAECVSQYYYGDEISDTAKKVVAFLKSRFGG